VRIKPYAGAFATSCPKIPDGIPFLEKDKQSQAGLIVPTQQELDDSVKLSAHDLRSNLD
jgi:hypothetical protein